MLKHALDLCCAARGHALAVFNLLALPPSLRSGSARSKNSLRPAQHPCFIIAKNLKKAISLAKAPSHEKHFAPLDVRGLWHARPLPTASVLDKSRPAAAQQQIKKITSSFSSCALQFLHELWNISHIHMDSQLASPIFACILGMSCYILSSNGASTFAFSTHLPSK